MRRLIPLAVPLLLAACATPQNNYDPLEKVNRGVFFVNNVVDKAVVKPVATVYANYTPPPIKTGTSNFFGNVDDLFSSVGSLLQGKFKETGKTLGRVAINTTLGVFGIFDWASGMNLPKPDEDIGQAFGRWGMGTGPYLMLPLLGPSDLRDVVDPAVRSFYGPVTWLDTRTEKIIYTVVDGVNMRAQVLPLDAMIESQPDPYAYIRDAYLQRRWYKVYDGNPPHPLQLGEDADDGDDADLPAPAQASGVASVKPAADAASDAAPAVAAPAATPDPIDASAPAGATQ